MIVTLKTEKVILRNTKKEDLDYVIEHENREENAQFVGNWTREQHLSSLINKDILHLVLEDIENENIVGYMIMAGIENGKNIELKRIVISEKGRGFGKDALKLAKKLSFESLGAHRLWLDVRLKNKRAQEVYKKVGFIEEGILRECILHKGSYESLIVMSILESEYEK